MQIRFLMLLAFTLLWVSACGPTTATPTTVSQSSGAAQPGAKVQISETWARAASGPAMSMPGMSTPQAMGTPSSMGMGAGPNSAVYMKIRNLTSNPDKLIKAQSDVSNVVELHTVEKEGDVMKMKPVPAIEVPANGEVALQPGGFHVMLIGLKKDLNPGDKVRVKLTFEKAGELDVEAEVRKP
jgi:hypothetical protein